MPSDRPRWFRRRIVIGIGLAALVLAAAGAVFALTRPGDVFNPDVEFQSEPAQTPVREEPSDKGRKGDPLSGFQWAQYGYSKDRRRYLPTREPLRPPFKRRWNWHGHVLLEFPPIIVGNRLFVLKNNATLVALNRQTGKV